MIIYLNIQNRFYTKVQIVKKILNFLLILIESNTMANQYYQEKCFIYIYIRVQASKKTLDTLHVYV